MAACLIRKCRRDSATCRCGRCGRTMHDWERVEKRELRSELRGHSREGRMRYESTFVYRDRCVTCGVERRGTVTERVEH